MAAGCAVILGLDEFHDADAEGSGGPPNNQPCEPRTTAACYSGPEGTEGHGLCQAGTKTCREDGSGYGECVGEVLPQSAEVCSQPGDEDCDGIPCSDALWSRSYGSTNDEAPIKLAIDGQGNIFLLGTFTDTLSIGAETLTSEGGPSYFIAKLDSTGTVIWARSLPGIITDIAVDSSGNIVVSGGFSNSITIDGQTLSTSGDSDALVVALDQAGERMWATQFGDDKAQIANGIAVRSDGDLLIVGTFEGTTNFGGPTFTSKREDIFVARYSMADGAHQWSTTIGDAAGVDDADQRGTRIAVDSSDNIIIAGAFDQSVNLGSLSLREPNFRNNGFFTKLDSTGTPIAGLYCRECEILGITADSRSNFTIAGRFSEALDWGCGRLEPHDDSSAVLVVQLSPRGFCLWNYSFGGGGPDSATSVASDSSDNIVVSGYAIQSIDFGDGEIKTRDAPDLFVVKFDNAGKIYWSKLLPNQNAQQGRAVAVDPSTDAVVIAGTNSGLTDFGTGIHEALGENDIVVAKLAP